MEFLRAQMPVDLTRRKALETLTMLAVGSQAGIGSAVAQEDEEEDDEDEHDEEATLNRFATSIIGSEITGIYGTAGGRFFFNVQHPDTNLDGKSEPGIVGAVTGLNLKELPEDFPSVQIPAGDDDDYSSAGDGTPASYDKIVRTALGGYQPIAQGGTDIGQGEQLGIPTTPNGEPLGSGAACDFNGYVPAENTDPESDVHEGYLFTNWESEPGAMTRLYITSRGTGQWHVIGAQNIDFSDVHGTWSNCFGTVSPWGTPLTSEENYFIPNTAHWNDSNYGVGEVEKLARYLGHQPNTEGVFDENYPNPFRYGYIVEITDPRSDDPTPVKHYTLGRSTHENAVVMPDRKTVYTTADGTGKAFFKFVADEAGDLSAGTLYAAKTIQQGPTGGDPANVSFDLEWIELGHATNEEIESWITEYDDITQADYRQGETNYISEAEIQEWANGNADDDRVAFLESSRAAGAIGGTDEFRKMEAINIRRNATIGDYAYVAMSNTNESMLTTTQASSGSDDEQDHIQLDGNQWGAVYRMQLLSEGRNGAEHDFDIRSMEPVVTGGPNANICGGCPMDARPDSNSTVCQDCQFNPRNESEDGIVGRGLEKIETVFTAQGFTGETTIAEPDNIIVMDDGRVVIGEDTGNKGHENNMIWIYNPGPDRRGRNDRTDSSV